MENHSTGNSSQWGLTRSASSHPSTGFSDIQRVEFLTKSLYELEMMLQENIAVENYETCVFIRDEINRRIYS